jgi:AraC family transcriptional regulator of adaptative response / DNA-3-methyladenine glycosylase II
VTLRLAFRPPYDWSTLLAFLTPRATPGVERVEDGRYARTLAWGGVRGTVEVRRAHADDALLARVRTSDATALDGIAGRLRRVFDVDADPIAIGARLAEDPRLAPLVARRPGLRVPGAWDGFELAARVILGQQVTVAGATRLAGRVAAAYGERLPPAVGGACDGLTLVFPGPERLADADLAALGMPRARAAAICSLASAVRAGGWPSDASGGLDDAVARMRALPGVGEWTAQVVAMRALREPDAFPAADVGLRRAMATGTERPTAAQLLARAERWRPWRAYAAMHLWVAGTAAPGHAAARARGPERPGRFR